MDNEPEDRRSFDLSAHHTRFEQASRFSDYHQNAFRRPSCLMSDESAESDETTLRLDAPIDCPMGLLSQLHTIASTTVLLQE